MLLPGTAVRRWGFASCFAARGPSLDSRSLAQQCDCLQELAACENLNSQRAAVESQGISSAGGMCGKGRP